MIDFDRENLEHLFLIREASRVAARLAAERMTASELKRLRELSAHHARQPELAAGVGDYQRSRDDDYRFRIVKSARCERLEKMLLDEVYYQLRIQRLRSSTRPGRAQLALGEHREILAALVSRNPDTDERTMRRHIRNARLSTLSASRRRRRRNGASRRHEHAPRSHLKTVDSFRPRRSHSRPSGQGQVVNAPVRLERSTTRLKSLLSAKRAAIFPGTPNALFARVIEDLGYEAVYITGAGIANMSLGVPDVGLVTLTELAEHVAQICDVVSVPVLADADTGFGNAVNMTRTVAVLERAGAAGIQIEDQVFPKKCGHFKGKDVIPLPEMVQKVKAAVDSRRDGDFQIVARTDVRAVRGFAEGMERAHAFIEAGADATFVEAPVSAEELTTIARDLPVPQLANMVFGGLTPSVPQGELAKMGFGAVLYANAALQAALKSVREVLGSLKQNGSLDAVRERLASFEERQRAVAKDHYDALEARYRD